MNQLVAWQAAVLSYTLFLIIDRRKIIMKKFKKIVAVALTVAMMVPTTAFAATSSQKKTGLKTVSIKSVTYTGKAQKLQVTVKDKNNKTVSRSGYSLSRSTVKSAGKYTITVKGKGAFEGKITKILTVKAAKNKITKASAKKAKAGSTVKIGAKAKFGKVKYTISKKYGKATSTGVKLAKGLKKGKKVKVKITVAKTKNYSSASKSVYVTVK